MAYETGGYWGALSAATADINGDSVLDIVTCSSDSIFVMLGIGDGTFGDSRGVPRPPNTGGVALGDLNGDGKPDLVVTQSYEGFIFVMLGNGDGTFGPPASYPGVSTSPYAGDPRLVAFGDANGDGHLDIVVTNPDSATVSLLINNGDGTFAPRQDLGTGAYPASALIADINGDGLADIVVADSRSATVSILRGLGNGAFLPKIDVDTGTNPYALAVADLNHDGRPDLVTANQASAFPYPSNVSVLLQNGDGTLGPKTQFATADGAQSLVIGDFDGDGALDVAVACSYNYKEVGTLSLLRGTGDGGFQPSVEIPCGGVPLGIAAGDLNHDGALDLVAVSTRVASVFLGNGNGTFGAGGAEFATGPFPNSVAIGDVNGDGKPDLMTANAFGTPVPPDPWAPSGLVDYTVSELRGDGLGGFGTRTDLVLSWSYDAFPFPTSFTDVKLSDFNGDGMLDALVEWNLNDHYSYGPGYFSGGLELGLGHGDGTFGAYQSAFSKGGGGTTSAVTRDNVTVTVGDVNGDHLADLVAVFNNHVETYQDTQDWGEVWVLLNHGDGTFAAADSSDLVFSRNQYSVPLKNEPLFATLGDFNGDGKQDLVVVDIPAGSASVLPGVGDGTFRPAMTFAVDTGPTTYPPSRYPLAVSDLNGDGKQDLVAGHQVFLGKRPVHGPGQVEEVAQHPGPGDGTFTPGPDLGAEPSALAIGDLDGDGIPDVAMVDGTLGMVAIQLGIGDGTFRKKQIYGVAANSLAMGDVNRDGRLDLVTTNSAANTVSVLLNTLPSLAAASPSTPASLRLLAPRPNPSRARVQIEFQLPRSEAVDAQVFDVAGRRTRTLFAGQVLGPGDHLVSWDGRDAAGGPAAPGLYLVRFRAGGETRLARVVRTAR